MQRHISRRKRRGPVTLFSPSIVSLRGREKPWRNHRTEVDRSEAAGKDGSKDFNLQEDVCFSFLQPLLHSFVYNKELWSSFSGLFHIQMKRKESIREWKGSRWSSNGTKPGQRNKRTQNKGMKKNKRREGMGAELEWTSYFLFLLLGCRHDKRTLNLFFDRIRSQQSSSQGLFMFRREFVGKKRKSRTGMKRVLWIRGWYPGILLFSNR